MSDRLVGTLVASSIDTNTSGLNAIVDSAQIDVPASQPTQNLVNLVAAINSVLFPLFYIHVPESFIDYRPITRVREKLKIKGEAILSAVCGLLDRSNDASRLTDARDYFRREGLIAPDDDSFIYDMKGKDVGQFKSGFPMIIELEDSNLALYYKAECVLKKVGLYVHPRIKK